jgi:hypothetical protein
VSAYGTEERPVDFTGSAWFCRVETVSADLELDEDASNEHDAWGKA